MMTMEQARQWAAQCWGDPRNSNTPMDSDLAESFAYLLMTRVNEGLLVQKMQEARKIFSEAFQKDPGFRYTYVANIAMLLCDRYNGKDFRDREVRSQAASDILDLMFEK